MIKNRLPYMTITSVPGRVCFYGDNVDWISGPALLCSLENLRTFVKIINNKTGDLALISHNFKNTIRISSSINKIRNKKEWFHYVLKVINVLEKKFKFRINGINIEVNSTLPIGAGLSSSAALCVAVSAALNEHFNLSLTPKEIAHISYLAEKYELGIPCGQMDQYSVALGGLIYVNCSKEPPIEIEKFSCRKKFIIVVGDTQITRDTGTVINDLKIRLNNKDPLILKYTKEAENIIRDARIYLRKKQWNLRLIGHWLNNHQKILKDYLLTSNNKLNLFTLKAVQSGAFGAKLSGAGKGGCMFAITELNNYETVAKSLKSLGAKVFIGHISDEGIRKETIKSYNESKKYSYSFT